MTKSKKPLIVSDDGNLHWCSYEKAYRSVDDFPLNKKGGYHFYCRDCMKVVSNTPENNKNDLLTILGYKITGDIPVSEQFNLKHKIT